MKNILKKIAILTLSTGLLASTSALAQNAIGGAVQQGNGAYVQKTDRQDCLGANLLGIPGFTASCLTMTQVKFLVTPSNNRTAVWKGELPVNQRPAKRFVHNTTYSETVNGETTLYDVQTITEPNGSVITTLSYKQNGKGKSKSKA
ncbi:hypothetical protein [Hymenobacter glacieicola]|uniref:Lipocalin-like domain-containing protein n=1 Tax=Hymenobacter glacieicola TaxID=1562124 RepID=A0ABQ1WRU1_9BACT|nr:hypothetical protein [Hymenobacter glacieicola]GGG41331.1 hypothetical protein GCM10011378_16990 [Hymenobacter glacieicola]